VIRDPIALCLNRQAIRRAVMGGAIFKYATFARSRVSRQCGSVKMPVSGLSAPLQGA
jgi:hypothetical protein